MLVLLELLGLQAQRVLVEHLDILARIIQMLIKLLPQ
jgi:hypothetical protein